MSKQKIKEILITALVSALIAFLQNLLSQFVNTPELKISPETTGALGGTIYAIRQIKFC